MSDPRYTEPENACGLPAAELLPKLGLSYACVLAKDHDGLHAPGGKCFEHGGFVGQRCPLCQSKMPATTQERPAASDVALRGRIQEAIWSGWNMGRHERLDLMERLVVSEVAQAQAALLESCRWWVGELVGEYAAQRVAERMLKVRPGSALLLRMRDTMARLDEAKAVLKREGLGTAARDALVERIAALNGELDDLQGEISGGKPNGTKAE